MQLFISQRTQPLSIVTNRPENLQSFLKSLYRYVSYTMNVLEHQQIFIQGHCRLEIRDDKRKSLLQDCGYKIQRIN